MSRVSESLKQLRLALQEKGEEAWGPTTGTMPSDASEGEPGEGGATNVSDIADNFDRYILGIVDEIVECCDMTEDEAIDYTFDVALALAEDGTLPPIPDVSDLEGTAAWIGSAATMQFGQLVLAMLDAETEEE